MMREGGEGEGEGEGEEEEIVWVKEASNPPCFGQSDWAAIVPRALAPTYFEMYPGASQKDCEWYVIGVHLTRVA